jgi:hypothetical protein
MATPTSHETENMAPPTTAENAPKHPRGRGGLWRDMLSGKPMAKPEPGSGGKLADMLKGKPMATPENKVREATSLTPRVNDGPVSLTGVHEPSEALQRSVMALRGAGYKRVKADAGAMMVQGHKLTYSTTRVPATHVDRADILLTRAPEGHRAQITVDTGGTSLTANKNGPGIAAGKIADQFAQLAPAPTAEPQLDLFKPEG